MATILFILVLSFLVIIHELGHFFAAKWSKVKVDEFGIGYPPKILKLFKWMNTEFTLNWIPFGGFVRMQGEEPDLNKENKSNLNKKEKSSSINGMDSSSDKEKKLASVATGQFYQASTFKKLVIILAGASVNFIFGVIAFAIVFSKMGIPQVITEARIGEISANSPAEKAGIKPNVNITGIQINNKDRISISSVEQIVQEISQHKGETVKIFTSGNCESLACDETESEHSVHLRTTEETPDNQGSLGVVFNQVVYVFYPPREMPFKSIVYGLKQAMYLGTQIVQVFGDLVKNLFIKGNVPTGVAGPIGIVYQAQKIGIFEQGFLTVLSFAGMLSINLAVMNVLPLPPLDGGRALFIVLELIFKKKRTQKIEYYFNYVGYIFLLGLIVFITIKDVLRIFGR